MDRLEHTDSVTKTTQNTWREQTLSKPRDHTKMWGGAWGLAVGVLSAKVSTRITPAAPSTAYGEEAVLPNSITPDPSCDHAKAAPSARPLTHLPPITLQAGQGRGRGPRYRRLGRTAAVAGQPVRARRRTSPGVPVFRRGAAAALHLSRRSLRCSSSR